MEEFTIIDKKHNTIEIYDNDSSKLNQVHIKQYMGLNTENKKGTLNYTLYKNIENKQLKLHFMLYKIQNRYYININNTHVIEIGKFLFIKHMTDYEHAVIIHNTFLGEFLIENCDIDLITKCIHIVEQFKLEHKRNFFEYLEYLFV